MIFTNLSQGWITVHFVRVKLYTNKRVKVTYQINAEAGILFVEHFIYGKRTHVSVEHLADVYSSQYKVFI